MDRDLLDEFLYRLYCMYLAVLAARMAAGAGDQPGHGDSLFSEQPRPRPRNPFPWDAFVGPIPGDAVRHQPRLQPGLLSDWRWPQDFILDLVRWARALAWAPGPAEVSPAELALDYEAFVGRALPASPDHRLRGTRLPLGERAQILRKAMGLAERHLAAGALLSGAPLGRCRSLLPLGGRVCAGLSARPYFAARHEVMLQLMRLAAHCRDSWARRLRAPARMRPQHGDRFLMDSQGALCLVHRAPSCARCGSLGWGISRCCRAGHTGHAGPSGTLSCPVVPPRIAPGRQVLVPEARRAGAVALSSLLGRARPASQALPDSGPPAARRCAAPPRVPGTRPPLAPGQNASRPSKRRTPNRANRGASGGMSHRESVEGAAVPLSPQPRGGGTNPIPTPPALPPRGEDEGAPPSGGGAEGPPLSRPVGGGAAPGPSPPSPPAGAGASAEPELRQDAPPQQPPLPSLAERPAASLPDVFGRISAALSSRAPPRQSPPPPRGRHDDPPFKAARTVVDMMRARPPSPRAMGGAAAGDPLSPPTSPVAGAPPAASPPQSTLPPRRQHGRASTEET